MVASASAPPPRRSPLIERRRGVRLLRRRRQHTRWRMALWAAAVLGHAHLARLLAAHRMGRLARRRRGDAAPRAAYPPCAPLPHRPAACKRRGRRAGRPLPAARNSARSIRAARSATGPKRRQRQRRQQQQPHRHAALGLDARLRRGGAGLGGEQRRACSSVATRSAWPRARRRRPRRDAWAARAAQDAAVGERVERHLGVLDGQGPSDASSAKQRCRCAWTTWCSCRRRSLMMRRCVGLGSKGARLIERRASLLHCVPPCAPRYPTAPR